MEDHQDIIEEFLTFRTVEEEGERMQEKLTNNESRKRTETIRYMTQLAETEDPDDEALLKELVYNAIKSHLATHLPENQYDFLRNFPTAQSTSA